MSRHSKNNTALGFFTYAERQKLNYGTQKLRLGRESLRDFDACFLCLQKARSPVICPKGHLMCKECIYESILTQKKEIARQTKLYELQQDEIKNEKIKKDQMAQDILIKQFEKTQNSYLEVKPLKAHTDIKESEIKNIPASEREKKIALDIVEKQTNKSNNNMNCFWIPDLTPENNPEQIKKTELHPQCYAGEKPHKINIKKLIPVNFSIAKESLTSTGRKEIIYNCPCCVRTFTNGTRLIVLKNCGHVFCYDCKKKFLLKSQKCMLCEKKNKEKDMIELEREGTGFSSTTRVAEAKRAGIAFQ